MPQASAQSAARFLVFEGLDGSGKSTLMNAVDLELRRRGLSTVRTREPGGTPLAEDIRKLLLKTEGEAPVAPTELLL
ncbi:MAG: dTMP kinase, partial [Bdellovibrionota bacterium]